MSSSAASSKQSKKRGASSETSEDANKKQTGVPTAAPVDELQFEDPYGDEMEEEEIIGSKKSKKKAAAASSVQADGDVAMSDEEGEDDEEEILDEESAARVAAEEEAAEEAKKHQVKYVWRPGADQLGSDEKLDYDSGAYHMLHRMRVDWPCLSFDVLPDSLGAFRTKYPLSMYLVAGTQADHASKNKVMILKASDLHKTKHDDRDDEADEGDDSDSDPEDLDDDPILEEKFFQHPGGVNRIRVCPQQPKIVATHADTAHVHIWNIEPYVQALDIQAGGAAPATPAKAKPLFSFQFGSKQEGYSMAWNPHTAGRLIAGDGHKSIQLFDMNAAGNGWTADSKAFVGHSSSVEDLVWSPSEATVFASASSDKTIRIWDARVKEKCQQWIAAHKSDVNVIDWNSKVQHLLVSGADDGSVKIWDLRNFKSGAPAASFNWHRDAVTSVEWNPIEESCVAVSSADDSLSIWDMALEHDELPGHGAQMQEEVPPQLFFVHQGQRQIKEIHWHKQIPNCVVSTAEDGFNIFKPSNLD